MSHAELAEVFFFFLKTVTYFHCCAVAVREQQGSMWQRCEHIRTLSVNSWVDYTISTLRTIRRLSLSISLGVVFF